MVKDILEENKVPKTLLDARKVATSVKLCEIVFFLVWGQFDF